MQVKLLDRQDELDSVHSLVYQDFLRKGYIDSNPYQKYIHQSSSTFIFLAKEDDTLLGTLSLTINKYDNLANIWRLATLSPSHKVILQLFKETIRTIYLNDVKFSFLAVNPKDEKFYKKVVNAEVIGTIGALQEFNNAPALLMVMKTDTIPKRWFA